MPGPSYYYTFHDYGDFTGIYKSLVEAVAAGKRHADMAIHVVDPSTRRVWFYEIDGFGTWRGTAVRDSRSKPYLEAIFYYDQKLGLYEDLGAAAGKLIREDPGRYGWRWGDTPNPYARR